MATKKPPKRKFSGERYLLMRELHSEIGQLSISKKYERLSPTDLAQIYTSLANANFQRHRQAFGYRNFKKEKT